MKSERQFFPTVLKALKNFFTKNIPVKLIALSFAVLLWAYVIANQNPERIKTIENVAVTTTGDADMAAKNLVVRGDLSELLGTVDIRVSTDVVHYKDVDENTVTASINLSSVTGDGVTMLKVQASTSIGTIESITPAVTQKQRRGVPNFLKSRRSSRQFGCGTTATRNPSSSKSRDTTAVPNDGWSM